MMKSVRICFAGCESHFLGRVNFRVLWAKVSTDDGEYWRKSFIVESLDFIV